MPFALVAHRLSETNIELVAPVGRERTRRYWIRKARCTGFVPATLPSMRLTQTRDASALRYPVLAKPRFGSWGREVELCADEESLRRYLAASFDKPWGRAARSSMSTSRPQDTTSA